MQVQLICGFLGAGKTTLIEQLLQRSEGKVALLVNEAGDVGLDGEFLARTRHVDIMELPGGCVCCSLRHDLVAAVKDIYHTVDPVKLYIEPSGVAAPSGILAALGAPELADLVQLQAVVGVVEPEVFLKEYRSGSFGRFYSDQLQNSDIILLNKIDLVPEHMVDEAEQEITKINPTALIYRTTHCRVQLPGGERHRLTVKSDFALHLQTLTIRPQNPVLVETLKKLAQRLQQGQFGQVVRAKGLLNTGLGWVRFDYASGNYLISDFPEAQSSRIVFIGKEIKSGEIETVLAS